MSLTILPFSTPKWSFHSSCSFWASSVWPSPHQHRIRRSVRQSTWAIAGISLDEFIYHSIQHALIYWMEEPYSTDVYHGGHMNTKLQHRLRSPKIQMTNFDIITGPHMGWVRLICSTGLGPPTRFPKRKPRQGPWVCRTSWGHWSP